jgi:3-oxoacyl-[acyl-carrier protein] reductase
MNDPFGITDRVVVVTGATRGIGRAIADRCAAAGAHVVITSRTAADCEAVAAELTKDHGGDALGHACDVADAESVAALFEAVDAWDARPLHGLVNNAGYPFKKDLWERPLDAYEPTELAPTFRRVAAVDLDGARTATRLAVDRMTEGGSIVYVSSTPALSGHMGTPYTEAKAALLGLMRDVARHYGNLGIRANAVALGNIRTEHFEAYPAEVQEALAQEASLRRWGEPAEAADAILFLLSTRANFVTGQTLVVDGGTVMR